MDDQLGVRPKKYNYEQWTFNHTAAILSGNHRLTTRSLALNSYIKRSGVGNTCFLLALGINIATRYKTRLALVTPIGQRRMKISSQPENLHSFFLSSAKVLTKYMGILQNLNLTWPLMASIQLAVFLS